MNRKLIRARKRLWFVLYFVAGTTRARVLATAVRAPVLLDNT